MLPPSRQRLQREIRELRSALLGHIERDQKQAEVERIKRAKLEDAMAEIRRLKALQGRTTDNMSALLLALEAWLA